VVEVSGRTFPVDVLYRPPRPDEGDLIDAVANTVNEITELDRAATSWCSCPASARSARRWASSSSAPAAHRDPAAVRAAVGGRAAAGVPDRRPQRRVVLATNVAETSLTIPGIVYVVDAGVARVNATTCAPASPSSRSRRSPRPAPTSARAAAGRTANGVCFRLYDEADFLARPAYTDPEIKRVGLAGVILRMKALDLGDVESFPFLDPPQQARDRRGLPRARGARRDRRAARSRRSATSSAAADRPAARPDDPRRRDERALPEVLVLAAALGLQDPRERPLAAQQRPTRPTAKFRDEGSDFAGYLKLWAFWQEARGKSSKNQLYRLCRDNFLSFNRACASGRTSTSSSSARCASWASTQRHAGGLGRADPPRAPARPAQQDRHVEPRDAQLRRRAPDPLHDPPVVGPGPQAAAVGDGRRAGRDLAAVRAHRRQDRSDLARARRRPAVPRSYGHPHWELKQAQVMAREQVTLYGLPIVKDRNVPYGPIDPTAARELFIVHALVRHEYTTKGAFMAHNRAVLDEVQRIRDKARKQRHAGRRVRARGVLRQRIPTGVFSGKTFEQWRKDAEAKDPDVLHLGLDDVLLDEAAALSPEQFPDQLTIGGAALPLTYRFEPSEDDDGVTATVPLALLPQLDPEQLAWTIPGWHHALIEGLLENLPKATRKALFPLDQLATALAAELRPFSGPLLPALERAIFQRTGERVPRTAWDRRALPPYLTLGFRVVDEHDRELARGHDLAELQRSLAPRAQELWAKAPRARHERAGLTRWDFDALPASVTLDVAGRRLTAYPALVDAETTVDLRLLETAAAAEAATRVALRRLALLDLRTSLTKLDAQVAGALAAGPLVVAGAPATPRRQVVLRALDDAFGITPADPLPRTRAAWEAQLDEGRRALPIALIDLSRVALAVHVELEKVRRLQKPLVGKPGLWKAAIDDIDSQLAHLITPELVRVAPLDRLDHMLRYLKAIQVRLERLALDPQKDASKAAPVTPLWQKFRAAYAEARRRGGALEDLDEFGWLLEELRVQAFAPELRTAVPVSAPRLAELWASMT
jgi:ATP-dependent helicase HrpA